MNKFLQLKEYFRKRPEVLIAYLFGSYTRKMNHPDSDLDVAIYFQPENKQIELEQEKKYLAEREIWSDIETIAGINTDLVVLNRCPATLAAQILEKGKPLLIRDKNIWLNYYLAVNSAAEDFINFANDYYVIKQRSALLSEIDRHNLQRRLDFLKSHLQEFGDFKKITFAIYSNDRNQQRIIERWVENIVNATLDIAKIILASEKKEVPRSYRETLKLFGAKVGLPDKEIDIFSDFAGLRNILAHEYLDILFEKIKEFLDKAEPIYKKIVAWLEKKLS